jgi:4-hydroxyphenylacetate 3-monooxygenase
MLKTGAEHLESIRDGRTVYIGREKVADVTTHPAFRGGARTVAAIYDMKRDPANIETTSYVENGERYSSYYLRARSQADLQKRLDTHKKVADVTFGLFGRSPDHVAGLVTGVAMKPEVLDRAGPHYRDNLLRHWNEMRKTDAYAVFAAIPPAGVRHPGFHQEEKRNDPGLKVIAEDDRGVVVSGMKMLATSAIYANEILICNLIPLDAAFKKYAITASVACNTPGVSLWARQPYARAVEHELDYPLSYRFDETDSVMVCDNVRIPWEKVFIHDDADLSRGVYIMTPGNCFSNYQSTVRFWSKMSLLVGLASLICQSTGNDKIAGVRDVLGKLAAHEGAIGAMVNGAVACYEPDWPGNGYVCFNRRYMYAALSWCQESHTGIVDTVRELSGGNLLQMPADATVFEDPALRERFESYFGTPFMDPIRRWKLMKLAWDLIGSEFAGRHQLYEKFYPGTTFVVRNQSFREAPWEYFHSRVNSLIDALETPNSK